MLKQEVGNCGIQRTKLVKQKKQNSIKMSTPIEVPTSQIWHKGTAITSDKQKLLGWKINVSIKL